MRRLVVSAFMASGLVLAGVGTAHAEPAPTTGSAPAAAGKKMCTVTDPLLDEISGLVATGDGYVVVNDSSPQDSHKRVFFLDRDCEITERVSYSGGGPRDTEDLALSPDRETLWIADTGDNRYARAAESRPTVSLWSMPVDGSQRPRIHRLSYPQGDKHDSEALLLDGDGTPIIVTKVARAAAQIYVPTTALRTNNDEGVPLRRAGEITVPDSDTSGTPLARLARGAITGGAVSPDGTKVVLRTYLDALEWDVTDGDVLAALKGKPRVTPLPDEPFGEAITYSADGRFFHTVSDLQGEVGAGDNHILRYTPAARATTAKAQATDAAAADRDGPSWLSGLSLDDITRLVVGVGVLGLLLVGLGAHGIMRSRRRPPPTAAVKDRDGGGPKPSDAETELIGVGGPSPGPVSGRPAGRGPYGGGSRPGAATSAAVYGAGGAQKPTGIGVHGGAGRPGGGGTPGTAGGRPGAAGGRPGAAGGRAGGAAGRPGVSGGRPGGQPSGRPVGGGRPGGGVYGAPTPPATPPGRGDGRQPGLLAGGAGRPDGARRPPVTGPGRDIDDPGYGRGR